MSVFYREYLCEIVGDEDALFRMQDIQTYDGYLERDEQVLSNLGESVEDSDSGLNERIVFQLFQVRALGEQDLASAKYIAVPAEALVGSVTVSVPDEVSTP